jgi:RHS repeat-associated protein
LRSASSGGQYAYDGHGRRTRVISTDGSTRVQVYTLDGRLMWSASSGGPRPAGTTAFIHLGTKLIAELDSVQGLRYVHADALGSPVARTNMSGALVSRTRYEPYGGVASGAKPGPVNGLVGFTGHVQDPETDLVYMQQRYYDPLAGRFLSVDPVVTDANTGKSFGRYHYGNSNPYKFTDPDGRDPEMKRWADPQGMTHDEARAGAKVAGEVAINVAAIVAVPAIAEVAVARIAVGMVKLARSAAAAEKAAAKALTKQAERGIRSLEKRIAEHEKKLADFKENPTVRPGMEGQPQEVIEKAQQSRVEHLEKEIKTFKENINKLKGGG